MKFLVVVGILVLLSGPLLIGWVYSVNPSDFSSNIAVPLFDVIVLGLIILGLVSIFLSRMPISALHAKVIGVAFLLIPVAVFAAGNITTETACFGPCGGISLTVTVISCDNSIGACNLNVSNWGQSDGSVVGCTIAGMTAVLSPDPAPTTAGSSTQVTCTNSTGHGSGSGGQATGAVTANNAETFQWSGIWK